MVNTEGCKLQAYQNKGLLGSLRYRTKENSEYFGHPVNVFQGKIIVVSQHNNQ